MKKIVFTLALFLNAICCVQPSHPIILNELIGDTIDTVENDFFEIVQFKDFKEAIFSHLRGNNLDARSSDSFFKIIEKRHEIKFS